MKKLYYVLIFLTIASVCSADWRAELEAAFPDGVVLEFSNYNDWGIDISGSASKQTSGLPTVTAGSNEIDAYFSVISLDNNAIGEFPISWIGKSMRTGFDQMGEAPSALISWYAEGANLGYPDQYIFMMFHVPKTSIPYNLAWNESYPDVDTGVGNPWYGFVAWKIFDVATGFESSVAFGNSTLRSHIASDSVKETYGENFAIVNLFGYTYNSKKFQLSWPIAMSDCSGYTNDDVDGLSNASITGGIWNSGSKAIIWDFDVGQYLWAGEWFGVEWRFNRGTVNTADARVDLWIYDSDGTEVFHGYAIGFVGLNSCEVGGVTYFDDEFNNFNKFTTGSNRLNGTPGYTTCAGVPCDERPDGYKEFQEPSVTTDTIYMDDIIFNGDRIGTTYFTLLLGAEPASSTASGTASRR